MSNRAPHIRAVYEHPDAMTAEVWRQGRTVLLRLECDTLDGAESMEATFRHAIESGELLVARRVDGAP